MNRAKPLTALACLLDLLFVLIFAALLMKDPTNISASSNKPANNTQPEVEKIRLSAARQTAAHQLELRKLRQLAQEQASRADSAVKKATRLLAQASAKLEKEQNANQQLRKRLAAKRDQNVKITAINGLWQGQGCQTGRRSCWDINIPMPNLSDYPATRSVPEIRMTYPSLNCKASWQFIKNEAGVLYFKERILSGRCVNNGVIKLTKRIDNGLAFEWYKGRERAFGTLYLHGSQG